MSYVEENLLKRIEILKQIIIERDVEIEDLLQSPISPFSPDHLHLDILREVPIDKPSCVITTFDFPKPNTFCIAEDLERFQACQDWKGRGKWLRKCRWQLARQWARYAFRTFDQAFNTYNLRGYYG